MESSVQLDDDSKHIGNSCGVSDSALAASQPSPMKSEAERKMVRKLDMRIMPILCLLNSFSVLDGINIGNARLQGLPQDILNGDPTGVLFGWVNAAYYFPYIISQVPAAILFMLLPPHIWLGCICSGLGLCSMLTAASFDFPGIIVVRIALGFFQAGLSPICPLYFAMFYTPEEIGFRMAYWTGCPIVAALIGGLVAFGIQNAHTAIGNWRLLFIVEGAPCFLIGLVALFVLPDRLKKTRIFKSEERELALGRINGGQRADVDRTLNRKHVIAGLTDWKVHAFGVILFCGFSASGSVTGFLPTIYTTFGFTDAKVQIMTIPPTIAAGVLLYLSMRVSNTVQRRGPFIIGTFLLSGVGYTLLLVVKSNVRVHYFASLCIVAGNPSSICLMITWFTCNLGSESKRASGVALSLAIGQSGNILGSHLFPLTEGPRYIKGFAIIGALQFLASFVAGILYVYYFWENRRRDLKYGRPIAGAPVDTSELADEAPDFRYTP